MPLRCALARLELEQEGVAVAADGAQLVELGVVAGGDHAAVAHAAPRALRRAPPPAGRAIESGGASACAHIEQQQGASPGMRGTHLRQCLQRRAQAGELARPHLAQRDPRGDPLDVGAGGAATRAAPRGRVAQRGDGFVALARDLALAPRLGQPEAQRPAAHAGDAGVERSRAGWARPGRAASASARGCGGSSAAGRSARWRAAPSAAARGPARGPGCARRSSAAPPRRHGRRPARRRRSRRARRRAAAPAACACRARRRTATRGGG